MKSTCVGISVVLSVLLLVTPASARNLKSALEREMFGGVPSLLTVGGRPLLSADPRNFGQPILAIGKFGLGIGASLSRQVTETMGSEILSESAVLPVPSGSAGYAYEYDPVSGFTQQRSIGLGPVFNERVTTIGRGRFAFGVAYIRQDFDEYNGNDLSSLRVDDELFADPPDLGVLIEDGSVQATLDLDITTNSVSVWGTYGLTDWLDVSFLLPITVIDLKARSTVSIVSPRVRNDGVAEGRLRNGLPGFLPDSRCTLPRANRNQCRIGDFISLRQGTPFTLRDPRTGAEVGQPGFSNVVDETKAGISDLLLRAKAEFFEKNGAAFGGLLEFTLPTGNEDNFLGDGAFKTRAALLYSQRLWNDRIGFHLNFGGRVTSQTSRKNGLEYGTSIDWRTTEWLSLIAEFTASQRLDAEGLPADFFHGAFGFKTSPLPGLILNASFRIPANDDGLRSDLVYLVGLEYDF